MRLSATQFAAWELHMYLDTHPCDRTANEMFRKYTNEAEILKAEYEKKYGHDKYFQLNKVIDTLSESLQKIAKEYTVVIIVDELDRCVPEYAIKVLERLHHLTEEKSNIVTIVAVDKEKLKESINHIFGFKYAEEYLKKFINFDITLNNGEVSEKITEKYAEYIGLFNEQIIPFDEPIEEYVQIIFKSLFEY